MVAPLRHRQTKEAETDMFDLQPPRHISTLQCAPKARIINEWGWETERCRMAQATAPILDSTEAV